MTRNPQEQIARIEADLARAKTRLACEEKEKEFAGRSPELPLTKTDICPRCGADLVYDEIDIGVWVVKGNPGCPECHYVPTVRMDHNEIPLPPLQEMATRVHTANAKWWVDLHTGKPLDRNVGELLMLVISELAEAMEGHRKNLQDDKLPSRKMLEVELADAVIRLLDIAAGFNLLFEDHEDEPFTLTDNVGENLLQITQITTQAYQAYIYDIKYFPYWIEQAIRGIERLAEALHLDLWGAYEEKMAYNAVRYDHTIEGRKADGGKKY